MNSHVLTHVTHGGLFRLGTPQAAPKQTHLCKICICSLSWLICRNIRLPNTDITTTLDATVNKQMASVSFDSTVEGITVERHLEKEFPKPIMDAMDPNHVNTVIDYLNKPVLVESVTWSNATTRGTILNNSPNNGRFAWDYIKNVDMWVDKLKGFLGLRSTLCLRLEINGTPFHAGRLRLCYYPAADISDNKYKNHHQNFISLSQLPGVDIEASESAVTLRIPYTSIARFMELNAPTVRDWGRIYIVVASPLTIGPDGPTTVSARLWAWQEDVQLYGQTVGIITQGPDSLKAPSKPSGRLAPSDAEERPVTSFLASASNAVGALSKIPAVAPYTGPAAWALSLMSNVSSAFGWSKPSSEARVDRVYVNPFSNSANSNGVEPIHNLALDADSKVRAIDDMAPSGMDECSFSFIKNQFSYLTSVNYTDTPPVGDVQFLKLELAPRELRLDSGGRTYHTPVSWLASGFEYYRGGFDVKIKMAKTAFHRGKIQVSFVPGINPIGVTLEESAFTYRHIIDLSEGSEFCFRIPYMLPLDYLPCFLAASTFYMHYVTPLRSSGNVASTVAMDIYVRGAPDLQFQFPIDPTYTPFQVQGPIVVQGPDDLVNTGEIECAPIGGAVDPSLDVSFALESASEMPTSVLQVLKRYVKTQIDAENMTDAVLDFYPYHLSAVFEADATNTATKTQYQSFWLAPYAFQRGSVRHRVCFSSKQSEQEQSDRIDVTYKPFFGPVLAGAGRLGMDDNDAGYCSVTSCHRQSGGIIFSVPFASNWRCSPIGYRRLKGDTYSSDYPIGRVTFTNPGENGYLARAYGDDFQPLFFVGVPVMVTAST